MGTPTHVQVLIKRARGLKIKGKDGTNDAFVIIGFIGGYNDSDKKQRCANV